jgi:hypothetical protein
MDTSFWINYNPRIKVDHTLKKYFGKYLYKLVVYAPAGRLIDAKGSLEAALEHRRQATKHINYGGFWGYSERLERELNEADLEFISKLRDIRLDPALNFKLRVEEPRIQIYAETDQQLQDLVSNHFIWTQCRYVESICGPEDSAAEAVLNSGAIIRKKDFGYRYKVLLRDGQYGPEVKQAVLNYLTNLGPEQVFVGGSSFDMLKKSSGYIWNTHFFANDLDIISFLHIISPGMVSNYHELVVLPHK